jgi:hypothetical protein
MLLDIRVHPVRPQAGRTLVIGGQRHRRIFEAVEVLPEDRRADIGIVIAAVPLRLLAQKGRDLR